MEILEVGTGPKIIFKDKDLEENMKDLFIFKANKIKNEIINKLAEENLNNLKTFL